ncbi:60S ribosomal protein L9 [Portunus trituberculatus]|uniref:60S ribosomal protein L9 n=1 Tax=Portunus trituberculatus TaxID=210409 RepID=A0A5B7II40_PORTR|nr:60S ribosomal protein L9 [Portunus trituberculatus]
MDGRCRVGEIGSGLPCTAPTGGRGMWCRGAGGGLAGQGTTHHAELAVTAFQVVASRCTMKTIITSQSITIPKNVSVKVAKRVVIVKGPRGTLRRSFKDMKLDMKVSVSLSL